MLLVFQAKIAVAVAALVTHMYLAFLFGSESGNASNIARLLFDDAIARRGYAASSTAVMSLNDAVDQRLFEEEPRLPPHLSSSPLCLVIICSTHGTGDFPDNAQKFKRFLKRASANCLSGIQFAVLALGDTNYDQFCAAGKTIDVRLKELGATRFCDRGEADDGTSLEDAVNPWCAALWGRLETLRTASVERPLGPGNAAALCATPLLSAVADDNVRLPQPPRVAFLFGSQSGNSSCIANLLFSDATVGHAYPPSQVLYLSLDDAVERKLFQSACAAAPLCLVIVCSTHGSGDFPDNAQKFKRFLKKASAPIGSHVQFAVLALGDTNYDQFCAAGRYIDTRLKELGAIRICDRGDADDGTSLQDVVDPWCAALWGRLEPFRAAAAAGGEGGSRPSAVPQTAPSTDAAGRVVAQAASAAPATPTSSSSAKPAFPSRQDSCQLGTSLGTTSVAQVQDEFGGNNAVKVTAGELPLLALPPATATGAATDIVIFFDNMDSLSALVAVALQRAVTAAAGIQTGPITMLWPMDSVVPLVMLPRFRTALFVIAVKAQGQEPPALSISSSSAAAVLPAVIRHWETSPDAARWLLSASAAVLPIHEASPILPFLRRAGATLLVDSVGGIMTGAAPASSRRLPLMTQYRDAILAVLTALKRDATIEQVATWVDEGLKLILPSTTGDASHATPRGGLQPSTAAGGPAPSMTPVLSSSAVNPAAQPGLLPPPLTLPPSTNVELSSLVVSPRAHADGSRRAAAGGAPSLATVSPSLGAVTRGALAPHEIFLKRVIVLHDATSLGHALGGAVRAQLLQAGVDAFVAEWSAIRRVGFPRPAFYVMVTQCADDNDMHTATEPAAGIPPASTASSAAAGALQSQSSLGGTMGGAPAAAYLLLLRELRAAALSTALHKATFAMLAVAAPRRLAGASSISASRRARSSRDFNSAFDLEELWLNAGATKVYHTALSYADEPDVWQRWLDGLPSRTDVPASVRSVNGRPSNTTLGYYLDATSVKVGNPAADSRGGGAADKGDRLVARRRTLLPAQPDQDGMGKGTTAAIFPSPPRPCTLLIAYSGGCAAKIAARTMASLYDSSGDHLPGVVGSLRQLLHRLVAPRSRSMAETIPRSNSLLVIVTDRGASASVPEVLRRLSAEVVLRCRYAVFVVDDIGAIRQPPPLPIPGYTPLESALCHHDAIRIAATSFCPSLGCLHVAAVPWLGSTLTQFHDLSLEDEERVTQIRSLLQDEEPHPQATTPRTPWQATFLFARESGAPPEVSIVRAVAHDLALEASERGLGYHLAPITSYAAGIVPVMTAHTLVCLCVALDPTDAGAARDGSLVPTDTAGSSGALLGESLESHRQRSLHHEVRSRGRTRANSLNRSLESGAPCHSGVWLVPDGGCPEALEPLFNYLASLRQYIHRRPLKQLHFTIVGVESIPQGHHHWCHQLASQLVDLGARRLLNDCRVCHKQPEQMHSVLEAFRGQMFNEVASRSLGPPRGRAAPLAAMNPSVPPTATGYHDDIVIEDMLARVSTVTIYYGDAAEAAEVAAFLQQRADDEFGVSAASSSMDRFLPLPSPAIESPLDASDANTALAIFVLSRNTDSTTTLGHSLQQFLMKEHPRDYAARLLFCLLLCDEVNDDGASGCHQEGTTSDNEPVSPGIGRPFSSDELGLSQAPERLLSKAAGPSLENVDASWSFARTVAERLTDMGARRLTTSGRLRRRHRAPFRDLTEEDEDPSSAAGGIIGALFEREPAWFRWERRIWEPLLGAGAPCCGWNRPAHPTGSGTKGAASTGASTTRAGGGVAGGPLGSSLGSGRSPSSQPLRPASRSAESESGSDAGQRSRSSAYGDDASALITARVKGWRPIASNDSVIHMEFDVSGRDDAGAQQGATGDVVTWSPGDTIAILPPNDDDVVDALLCRCRQDGAAPFPLPRSSASSVEVVGVITPTGGQDASAPVPAGGSADMLVYSRLSYPITYAEVLRHHVSLRLTNRRVLSLLLRFTTEPAEVALIKSWISQTSQEWKSACLSFLRSGDEAADLSRGGASTNLLDVLSLLPSCKPRMLDLVETLPLMTVRHYSISSAHSWDPSTLTITFKRVPHGLCTTWLYRLGCVPELRMDTVLVSGDLEDGGTPGELATTTTAHRHHGSAPLVTFAIKANDHFQFPADPATPLVMIGPGTGIAPFRAFLQHRCAIRRKWNGNMADGGDVEETSVPPQAGETTERAGLNVDRDGAALAPPAVALGEAHLFFGCRTQFDYLYEDELDGFCKSRALQQLHVAFSQEPTGGAWYGGSYVQDRILECSTHMASLIKYGNAHIYICGDAVSMARDVQNILIDILEEYLVLSPNDARAYLDRLMTEGRFQKDLWTDG